MTFIEAVTNDLDQPLAALAFDHRELAFSSVRAAGITRHQIRQAKELIFEAYRLAVERGLDGARPALLIDEEFGADIAHRAIATGSTVIMPVERAAELIFAFEYGSEFREHLLEFKPAAAKALVQFRVDDPTDTKTVQLSRLRELSEFLEGQPIDFMLELIVGMGHAQHNGLPSADVDALCAAMHEIQQAGIRVDYWKVEGVSDPSGAERVAAQAGSCEPRATCVVLGAGAPPHVVGRWLEVAAVTAGYSGFAVGRSFWGEAVSQWLDGSISRVQALETIATLYRSCTLEFMRVDVR